MEISVHSANDDKTALEELVAKAGNDNPPYGAGQKTSLFKTRTISPCRMSDRKWTVQFPYGVFSPIQYSNDIKSWTIHRQYSNIKRSCNN